MTQPKAQPKFGTVGVAPQPVKLTDEELRIRSLELAITAKPNTAAPLDPHRVVGDAAVFLDYIKGSTQ